jgi:hypothetical protein
MIFLNAFNPNIVRPVKMAIDCVLFLCVTLALLVTILRGRPPIFD